MTFREIRRLFGFFGLQRPRIRYTGTPLSDLIFHEAFDKVGGGVSAAWSGYSLGHPGAGETPAASPNFAYIDAPGRAGEKCLQVTIEQDDYTTTGPGSDQALGKDRAELWWDPTEAQIPHGTPVWYQWSIRFPDAYSYVSSGSNFQIMGQFHDAHLELGYEPPFAIAYRNVGGQSFLRLNYGLQQDPPQIPTVPISRDAWVDLKFKILWSLGSDGYVDAYLNGVFQGRLSGRNVYPEQGSTPNQFRFGVYRGFNQVATNIFYLGRLKAARSEAGLLLP